MSRIYLDFNATAPLSPAARAAMARASDGLPFGNPSSIHAEGRRARDLVERARDQVARFAGCAREQVIFTSGGTEANRLAIELLAPDAGTGVEVAAHEHPSLRGLARAGEGAIAVMAMGVVNHETGVVAEVPERGGRLVHVDAVQAAGKLALAPLLARADTLAISAHKLGGPQGVGALIVRDADRVPAHEHGHQERGRRAGTENVLGIVGFGAVASELGAGTTPSRTASMHQPNAPGAGTSTSTTGPTAWESVRLVGEVLEAGILEISGARIHGAELPRIGGTINAGFLGARGESLVIALDLAGIAASTGAACTSGSTQPSEVLLALGLPRERALEAVRFSLGRTTTRAEIAAVLAILPGLVERARSVVSTGHA